MPISATMPKALTLVGILALILGLFLTVTGRPAAWLAWSGALLSITALATLHLLARGIQPELNRSAKGGLTTIYMPLLKDGVDVWRPVEAMKSPTLATWSPRTYPPTKSGPFSQDTYSDARSGS
jgi:hypothetical protein